MSEINIRDLPECDFEYDGSEGPIGALITILGNAMLLTFEEARVAPAVLSYGFLPYVKDGNVWKRPENFDGLILAERKAGSAA